MKSDDERLVAALQDYHRELLTNNTKISKRLRSDHGIQMRFVDLKSTGLLLTTCVTPSSASSVKRRRKELGLSGSGATMRSMPNRNAEQLVIAQMDRDPAKRHGVWTIQQEVAFHEGVHLTRYCTRPSN